jgi:hypothetical protein
MKVVFRIKRNEIGEFEVQMIVNGKVHYPATYFTDDRQDAEDTMADMKARSASFAGGQS